MTDRTHIAIEAAVVSVANKTTVGGALTGLAGWFAEVNWIGLIGALIAVAGLMISAYFQYRRDKREEADRAEASHARRLAERKAQEMHDAQIALLRDKCES